MIKKVGISAICMLMVLLLGLTPIRAVGMLNDIKDTDWYYENVMVLVNKGIIEGDSYGNFMPNHNMTVDQFIKTMVVALGYNLEKDKDYWAQPFIDKAFELGIIKEGEFTSFKEQISRGQMAILTVRVVEMLEGTKHYTYSGNEANKLISTIKDYSSINDAQKDYVLKAYELGTITGYPDGNFKANLYLKRSEACTVIRRVIDSKERVPYIYSGIEIMDNLDGHDPELLAFNIFINVLSPLEPQYIEAEAFLNKAVGESLTIEIMKVVKTKTMGDQILRSTLFKWDNRQKIEVVSKGGHTDITIRGW